MEVASFLTTLLFAFAIAISAKPILEGKLPMKLPLTELSSRTNHDVLERDRRRVKSFMRRAGDQPNDGSGQISLDAIFQVKQYSVVIDIGDPPTPCKLLQHLVAVEYIPTDSFFLDNLILDSGR
jgi:hypothetical protein